MARTRRCSIVGMALSVSLLGSMAAVTSGCADEAVSEAQAHSEATKFTKLGVCTVDEAADVVEELLNERLDKCVEAHPEIDVLTEENIYEFTAVSYYMHYNSVAEAIRGIMEMLAVTEITPEELRPHFRSWALPLIEADEDGNAVWHAAPLVVYSAIEVANRRNAFASATNPEGVDIEQLYEHWDKVTDGTMLDSQFLLPVTVSKDPKFAEIRKHFHGRWVEGWSWGHGAIDDFWNAQEGPEGNPAFEPIAEMLGSSGIKKRYYMWDAGYDYGPWSRNYLIVLDEHKQMYGFMMGYSE